MTLDTHYCDSLFSYVWAIIDTNIKKTTETKNKNITKLKISFFSSRVKLPKTSGLVEIVNNLMHLVFLY